MQVRTQGIGKEVLAEDNKKARQVEGNFTKKSWISDNLGKAHEQFKESLRVHSDSLREANIIQGYIEGTHYSTKTLNDLRKAGRSPEAYNLLLRVQRLLTGYFSKVVTTVIGEAVVMEDTVTVNLHNEHFKVAQRLTKWKSFTQAVSKDLITKGLGAWSVVVKDTGRRDKLGRVVNDVSFKHINSRQVLPDARALEFDMSDGKYIHYWEYMSYLDIKEAYGEKVALDIRGLHSDIPMDDYLSFGDEGYYNNLDRFEYWLDGETYIVVHTYSKKQDGTIELISWHGDVEMHHQEFEEELAMFPIQCVPLLRKEEDNRYYSPLYEACNSQDAINQALLKFQELVGASRVMVDNRAMKNTEVSELTKKLKMIDEVLHFKSLQGVKVERLTGEATGHLNKMYTSIQLIMEVIGINEAFLGQSKAGDSGRKFEGQRSASENTLEYIATPLDLAYTTMYLQCIVYSSVYKQAEEYLRFTDEFGEARWEQVNQPFFMPTGEVDEDGDIVVEPATVEKYNKGSKKKEVYFLNERAKSLSQVAVEVDIHSAPYDDTDSVELAFIEGLLNGTAGQIIANSDPAGLPYLYSLAVKHLKTRNSEEIAKYLSTLAQKLGGLDMHDPRLYANKNQGASGGTNGSTSEGKGSLGTQGTQAKQIQFNGGTINDNKPEGYNQPKGDN